MANIIILEFLSARFVHPGAPQLTILSFLKRVRASEKQNFSTTMTSELSK